MANAYVVTADAETGSIATRVNAETDVIWWDAQANASVEDANDSFSSVMLFQDFYFFDIDLYLLGLI